MLFKRRRIPTFLERLRVAFWPRVSWRRSFVYYVRRTLRLSATPHAIALGAACGVFVSFTPLVGFHILLGGLLAYVLRGNVISSAFGTWFGNPLTFPFIWATTYELGLWILYGKVGQAPRTLGRQMVELSFDRLWPVMKPMLVGSLPLGLSAGCIAYIVIFNAVRSYQDRRRKRFAARRAPADGGAPI